MAWAKMGWEKFICKVLDLISNFLLFNVIKWLCCSQCDYNPVPYPCNLQFHSLKCFPFYQCPPQECGKKQFIIAQEFLQSYPITVNTIIIIITSHSTSMPNKSRNLLHCRTLCATGCLTLGGQLACYNLLIVRSLVGCKIIVYSQHKQKDVQQNMLKM